MGSVVYIYVLIDPRDHEIRYVGKTRQTPEGRYRQHIKDAKNPRVNNWRSHWIAKLLRLGYAPVMDIVQRVPDEGWKPAEQYWIAYYRSIGCRLTNGTTGGDGHDSFTDEVRERMSQAAIRKFQNPEVLAKYLGNKNCLGRTVSDEQRLRQTQINLDRYGFPWENLAEDYERLGTCNAVAAEYGCNPETVRRALKRYNIKAHGTHLPKGEHTEQFYEFWKNLEADYNRLGSFRAVADFYGVQPARVGKAMKALGISANPRAGRKHAWTDEWRANHKAAINAPGVQSKRIASKQRQPQIKI